MKIFRKMNALNVDYKLLAFFKGLTTVEDQYGIIYAKLTLIKMIFQISLIFTANIYLNCNAVELVVDVSKVKFG